MDDIWIISWFNHTAFDANPIWKSPNFAARAGAGSKGTRHWQLLDELLFFEIQVSTAPQGSTGPQGSLGIPRNPRILQYFSRFFWIFCKILRFLIKIMWILSFSGKNDAESLRNLIKNSVLDPKRAKLIQKSYGKFTELPRPVQEDP